MLNVNFLKQNFLSAFIILILMFCSGCFKRTASQGTINPDELIVGMLTGYPPFYMIDTAGNPEGFDIDIAQCLASKMGKKLVIKTMTTAENIAALDLGKIDLLISGLCITKTRQKRFNFVHYLGEPRSAAPLVFWETVPADIRSLDDLQANYPEAQLLVEPGSSWNEFVDDQYPGISPLFISSYLDMVLELKKPSQKLKAILFDPDIVQKFMAKFPELKRVNIPLKGFEIPGMGIALKKGNAQLFSSVTTIIAELKRNDIIKNYENRWFKQ